MSLTLTISLLAFAIALVGLGGLFAAADAAVMALSRADLTALAEKSRRSARAIRAIEAEPAAHLNAMSFVRVLAETTAAVVITATFAGLFDNLWVTLISAAFAMTAVTFVLVGSSPRTVGSHHPEAVLRFAAPLVRFARVVLGPLAAGLIRLGDRVTPGRASGGRIRDEQQLLSMVDQAAESEVLEADDREVIHSVLEMSGTVVREIMVPRTDMVTVDVESTVAQALEQMVESRHSRLPVITDDVDEVLGVLYLRDLSAFALRHAAELHDAPARELMKPAQFIPESQKADDAMREMQHKANHLALIVDEYGGIAGLITLEDLVEELIGDIRDEHDRHVLPIQEIEPGVYRVSARLEIDELGDLFEIELDDDDVDTAGGLFTKLNGALATPGDSVTISGIEMRAEVTQRKTRNLVSLIVRRELRD